MPETGCDCSSLWPGILWPWAPDGDDSLPYVERCDVCGVYTDDDAAAVALADKLELRVMYATLEGETDPTRRSELRPFVMPHLPEVAGDPPDWHVEVAVIQQVQTIRQNMESLHSARRGT